MLNPIKFKTNFETELKKVNHGISLRKCFSMQLYLQIFKDCSIYKKKSFMSCWDNTQLKFIENSFTKFFH